MFAPGAVTCRSFGRQVLNYQVLNYQVLNYQVLDYLQAACR
jgi:hypothetical protein